MVKLLSCVVLTFALAGCAAFTSSKDEEAAKLHLQIGTSHLNNGNYPQALSELLLSENLDPNDPITENNLGLAFFLRERTDLAEVHIRKALKLKPNYSDARNNLARVLIERGKYHEAIQEAKIVVQDLTYPSPEKPLLNVGIAQFKLGQYEAAKKTFLKAIDYQKDSCMAQSYYGRTLFEMKDYIRASEALDRAAGFCLRMQFDEPHYYSALSYYELGDKKKAETRFESLLKLYPQGKYQDRAKSMLEIIRR